MSLLRSRGVLPERLDPAPTRRLSWLHMRIADGMAEHLQAQRAGTIPAAGPPVFLEAARPDEQLLPRAGSLAVYQPFTTQQIEMDALAHKHGSTRIDLMLAMQEVVSDDSQIFAIRKKSGRGHEVTVGRTSHSDIAIVDSTVSAAHAVIDCRDRVVLKDVGSSNGTFVNHTRLGHHDRIVLQSGDCVRFGKRVFYYINGDRLILFMQLRIAGAGAKG